MDAEQLRQMQAPLKARYKADPHSALVTMRARGVIEGPDIAIKLDIDRSNATAGLHKAAGGTGTDLCSGDMLLEALVGCAGVTLKAVATAMSIAVDHATVTAEAECDFRGTLGTDKSVPVGLQDIRLSFDVVSSAPQTQLDQLVKLAERYCVVYQTLKSAPQIDVVLNATAPAQA